MPTMSPDYQLVQLLPLIDSHPKLEHFLKITAHHLLTPPPPHTHTHTYGHTHTQHTQPNSMSFHLILNSYACVCSISPSLPISCKG